MKKGLIIMLLLSFSAVAQKPLGRFLDTGYYTGKPLTFSLTFKHQNKQDVVFPDSTYNFSPFKLKNIEYFPTRTNGKFSTDSVVYSLVTFEVDSIIALSLPVTVLSNKQKYYSLFDTISIIKTIRPQDLIHPNLKPSTTYFNIPFDINLPKLLYYLFVLLLSGLLFFAIFGKEIKRQYTYLMFYARHRQFTSDFKKLSKNWKKPKNINNALVLWKNHMENLNQKPYLSMTTKEITETLHNERLDEALKEIDASIYGGANPDHIPFAFKILTDIISDSYKKQSKILREELRSQKNKNQA